MEQVVGAREEVYDWFNLQIFFAGENSSSKGGKIFERFNRRGLKYILQGRTVVAGENSSSKGGKIFERFNRRGLKYILHSSCNWGSASMWLIQGRPDRRRKATAGGGRSPQENADGNDAADDTNDDGSDDTNDDTNDDGNDDSDGKDEVGDGKNFEKSQMNSRRSLENSLNHY